MFWRLGLDLGTNSIGWAILELVFDEAGNAEPIALRDMGVRIFPDGREPAGRDVKTGLPKIGESLAVARRLARGMRRNRDRRQLRLRKFADTMAEFGLFDGVAHKNKHRIGQIDPRLDAYHARAEAASQPVGKDVLARALLHLNKRRGFLSNRKANGEDREATERKSAMLALDHILAEREMTLGQYLHERRKQGHHVRFRGTEFVDADKTIPIYPTRRMYTDEFHAIRRVQVNVFLSDEQWDELLSIMTFQRPLKPQEIGICTFEHGDGGRERHVRASRHLPIAHDFRIIQEINNLRYQNADGESALTPEQRKQLFTLLQHQKNMTWSKIRTSLRLKGTVFNLESEQRKHLIGNETACTMRALFSKHDVDWDALGADAKNDIVQILIEGGDLAAMNDQRGYGWSSELIETLSAKTFSSSHGHLSRRCMEKLLPLMGEGKLYWEAASEVYGDHTDYSQFATGEVLEELPYYGEVLRGATMPARSTPTVPENEQRFGRIPNPTVHVALNQLRKLVNALIRKYGSPYEIHLELARELKTAGAKYQELLKGIAENTKANDSRRIQFAECFGGKQPTATDLMKMRLWEELGKTEIEGGAGSMARVDVYTGRVISFTQLFSAEIEIEHILPFGRTYDDSMANKTVTFRDVNRRKGGHLLPYDFACADSAIDSEAMMRRAQSLPKGKRWRFLPDAADIYERMITRTMTAAERRAFDADKSGAFIDRQLVDTRYASRLAARYLVPVVGDPARVIPVNGHVTNMLRHRWDINLYKDKGGESEREDNRHHAEDALLVALASRSLVKRVADETRLKQEGRGEFKARLCFPERPAWITDEQIRAVADRINVSYRPDHSREARFFAETAYGFVGKDDPWRKESGFNLVVRRNVLALKEKELAQIRDRAVREAVVDFLESPEIKALKKWEDRLARLAQTELRIGGSSLPTVLRHVRIGDKEKDVNPVPSAPYKGYKTSSLAFCDIWAVPKKGGKTGKKYDYKGSYIDYIQAKRFEGDEDGLHLATRPHPAARKIMRLHKSDMVLIRDDAGKEIPMRVVQLLRDNRIVLRRHTVSKEGDDLRRSLGIFVEQYFMRKICVDIDGSMRFVST